MIVLYETLKRCKNLVIVLATFALSSSSKCQIELVTASYATAGFGPTVASQTATFLKNTSGTTFVPYDPPLTVTASLSNQLYNSLPQLSTGTGTCFGANLGGPTVNSELVFLPMNSIGDGINSQFTVAPGQAAGTGIDITINNGFALYNLVQQLIGQPLNGRFLFGTLTLTFNRAVANPVIHFVGLGSNYPGHGASTEFELQTPGVTLVRLSGSAEFTVSSNKILNNSNAINSTCGAGSACGSAEVAGMGITSLAFNVYIRGDGGGTEWAEPDGSAGDKFMVGVSLADPTTMPVTSLNLSAFHSANNAYLQWITFTEQHTNYFVIERSTNITDFVEVGRIKAGGNRNTVSNYFFTDRNVQGSLIYYRVRLTDEDGRTTISNIAAVRMSERNTDIKIFPNPAHDNIYIELNTNGKYQLDLFNAQAQRVLSQGIIVNSNIIINIKRNNLPPGIYMLRIYNSESRGIENYKIVMQ